VTSEQEAASAVEEPDPPQIEERQRRPRLGIMVALLVAGAAGVAGVWWSRSRPHLPAAPVKRVRPKRPVVIINPLSGDGRAKEYDLASAAADLGLETVTFEKGDDLQQLAHDAVDRGADLLMMAGGDGSLAAGAEVAMQRGVRFACVPVGTRNHFAMDLGLDRDDPVQALNAGIDGVEVDVNVGHVGGQVFLNNVSFGIYAEAIADPDYRDHRVESVADATKDTVEGDGDQHGLAVQTPSGETRDRIDVLLVSNNPYQFIGPPDYGGRAALDTGRLGVVLAGGEESARGHDHPGMEKWSAPTLTVRSPAATIDAGVDGELVTFDAPVEMHNTSVLRVLLPTQVVAREMKVPTIALSGAALEHLSGARAAVTAGQAGE
jgi:diacylglycerol kinase family enzyme